MRIARFGDVFLVVLGMGIGVGGSAARATLIAYEPFDYAAGPLAGASGGVGFAGAWTAAAGFDVQTHGLTAAGAITPSGNAAHIEPTANPQSSRTLASFISNVGDTWVSFIHQRSDAFPIAQWLVVGNLSIGSTFNGTYGISTYPGGFLQDSQVSFVGHDPDLLVAHMRMVAGIPTLDLFLNPTSGPVNPILSTNVSPSWAGQTIRLYTQNGAGGSGAFDEIRIGTTFDDVAVPAPGAWCGIGAAGIAVALRRRR